MRRKGGPKDRITAGRAKKVDFKAIKLIAMDVDGVLTDGRIVLGHKDEMKFFDVRDGMGITLAQKAGLKIAFITSRGGKVVERRAKELRVDYLFQGCEDKAKALAEILKKEKLFFKNAAYIGDDIVDITPMRKAGFAATVSDAPEYIMEEVDYVSAKKGGRGAVREIVEHVLKGKNALAKAIEGVLDG